jgi:hypothetical protein
MKILAQSAVTLFSLLLLAILGADVWWNSNWLYGRDYENQEKIAEAYFSFYKEKSAFPNSLKDLVDAGYLPERSKFYLEPPGFFRRKVNYKEGSYEVFPPKNNDFNSLTMIGRKDLRGSGDWEFQPTINASLRDKFVNFSPTPSPAP